MIESTNIFSFFLQLHFPLNSFLETTNRSNETFLSATLSPKVFEAV